MRRYAPLYEGDSILRPDAAFGEPAFSAFEKPASALDFVRSNNQADAANLTVLDIAAAVQAARALRSTTIARLLSTAYKAVVDWLDRNDQYERDQFFSASTDLADLERRQRHWERTGRTHY